MATVNENLQERSIRHSTYLERVKAGTTNKLIKQLGRVEDDLIDQIRKRAGRIAERGYDTGPETTARLNALFERIRETSAEAYAALDSNLRDDLQDLVKNEAQFQTGMLREELPEVVVAQVGVTKPDLRSLYKIANARPFQGRLLKEWMDGLERDAARRIRDQVRIGLVEGESIDSIVRRVRGTRARGFKDGVIAINRRNAEAVIRTAVNHTMTVAREETYKDNRDILKGTIWTSSLDSRTCTECAGLDQRQFPVDSGRRPPAHHGCRCTTTPLTKSWRELGIDMDEMTPGTRQAMDGKVPATMDYGQWLRKQNRETVEDALGPSRAKLFREGKLDIKKFTDIRGRELSLSDLRARERSAFEAAGLLD